MRKPYVILIGSASGIGKSTIASQLSKELNIKHLIESDFIRAVIRGIIGREYAPALHSSSYDAYKHLRNQKNYTNYKELVSAGFDEHASYVIPGLEKIIQRAITDFDDIIIEGVHLVPGLIDTKQFEDYAEIYFFILSSDEEAHKQRFVKRAIEIHRGGKQLDFFCENRIIHNHLISQAEKHDVPVINTDTIDKSLKQILTIINKSYATVKLINSVEQLEDVIDIIINQNNGSIEKITYKLKGFKDYLERQINITDYESAKKFINKLNENEDIREDLTNLYNISSYRELLICAENTDIIDKIKKELKDKGYVYNE